MTRAAAAAACPAPPPVDAPIRVLIVDDSTVARAVLGRMLVSHGGFEIVAEAASAAEALAVLGRVTTDVILLDVDMPGGCGLEALPDILRAGRGARVLVVSSACEQGARTSVEAIARGASATLPKPGTEPFSGRFSVALAERVRAVAAREDAPAGAAPSLRPLPQARLGCLAVGASTGGLRAIAALLEALPKRIGAPILVTQHLPALFMPLFARQLSDASGRPVRIGEEGMVPRPEEILLAPGDGHLVPEIRGSGVSLAIRREPAATGCMPSVDAMLSGVASAYGRHGVAVILSGMGRDGLSGARALVDRGGAVLAQDRGSAAVWGMPKAVVEAGLVSAVRPPAELARLISGEAA